MTDGNDKHADLMLAVQAEDQIMTELEGGLNMELPSTHDSIAQAEYEERWIKILVNAFRKMPRPGRG